MCSDNVNTSIVVLRSKSEKDHEEDDEEDHVEVVVVKPPCAVSSTTRDTSDSRLYRFPPLGCPRTVPSMNSQPRQTEKQQGRRIQSQTCHIHARRHRHPSPALMAEYDTHVEEERLEVDGLRVFCQNAMKKTTRLAVCGCHVGMTISEVVASSYSDQLCSPLTAFHETLIDTLCSASYVGSAFSTTSFSRTPKSHHIDDDDHGHDDGRNRSRRRPNKREPCTPPLTATSINAQCDNHRTGSQGSLFDEAMCSTSTTSSSFAAIPNEATSDRMDADRHRGGRRSHKQLEELQQEVMAVQYEMIEFEEAQPPSPPFKNKKKHQQQPSDTSQLSSTSQSDSLSNYGNSNSEWPYPPTCTHLSDSSLNWEELSEARRWMATTHGEQFLAEVPSAALANPSNRFGGGESLACHRNLFDTTASSSLLLQQLSQQQQRLRRRMGCWDHPLVLRRAVSCPPRV